MTDLREFQSQGKRRFDLEWNDANNKAAKDWNRKKPATEAAYLKFYEDSQYYISAMAAYNLTGKKLRLIEKLSKVFLPLKDVKTIADFGSGVGSDSLTLAALGYRVKAVDLESVGTEFFRWRMAKYGMKNLTFHIADQKALPPCDMVFSLDTLEHVFDPYATLRTFFAARPRYLLMTTAFGVHETADHTIPMHTDFPVGKIEKFIADNGYKKQKLPMMFPPRFFVKK